MEDTTTIEEEETNKDIEVAPALIAVHPTQKSVAVAVGSDLRIFDIEAGCAASLVDDLGGPFHRDSIRAIQYGAEGKLFVSAGDDKIVKIWSTKSLRCICTVCSEKRVTAVAISNDGLYVCFADKFGVVWVVDLVGFEGNQTLVNKKATQLLSHYCSIITSLEFSPDGQFIVSADRDNKIRVTIFPTSPLDGAHEIQSFCLGHTEFISCLAFVCARECLQSFLVSGSGDSTVRLWDISSGDLLDNCEVGIKAGLLESNGSTEQHDHAVTDICTIQDGVLLAVAIQRQVSQFPCHILISFSGFLCWIYGLELVTLQCSLQGIVLMHCNLSARTLSVAKVVSIAKETFIPTSLGTSPSSRLLWMVTGVSNLPGFDYLSFARVRVISGFDVEQEPAIIEDNKIPGGDTLLENLQGSAIIDEKIFLAAAEAVKTAMCNLLIKKQYPAEKREFRKKTRNDRKVKY